MIADLLLALLEDHSALIWSVVSGIGGLVGAYILATQKIRGEATSRLLVERERVKNETVKEMTTQEAAERTAFRAGLMAELTDLRKALRDCEDDRRQLAERITSHSADLKMLQAECSIMKMQMRYLTGNAPGSADKA
jgi:uncharacterized protein (DUF3084 family)